MKIILVKLFIWIIFLIPILNLYGQSIEKSQNDKRKYRYLQLDNGIKVVLVSDPNSINSAASMNINTGSFYDGEVQGLTHFNEHMLFLGTKKYPEENEYSNFISSHNGSHNAYTSSENTNYYFAIDPNFFDQALDRFAQFFISPNYAIEFVEREINAVNAEHSRNLANDFRKVYEVSKIIYNESHPASKFATGNFDTLSKYDDLKARLEKFFNSYYTGQAMSLAIVDVKPLDEIEELVIDIFSEVSSNKPLEKNWSDNNIFNRQLISSLTSIKTIKDNKKLNLIFPLEPLKNKYDEKVGYYIGSLFGDEGPGSILQVLKEKGLANGLSAGVSNYQDYSIFYISVDLTNHGAKNINNIITIIFNYQKLVLNSGVSKDRYDEMVRISNLEFEYKSLEDPKNYVIHLSNSVDEYPVSEILTAPYLLKNYDEALLKKIIKDINPNNFYAFYSDPNVVGENIEPWYQTSYKTEKFSKKEIEIFNSKILATNLSLPKSNQFIPKKLNVFEQGIDKTTPVLIKETDKINFWFNQNKIIKLPKAVLNIRLLLPQSNGTITQSLQTNILINIWKKQLNAKLYPARLVGMDYSINFVAKGIDIKISGYNDSILPLISSIIEEINSNIINEKVFNDIKEIYEKQLANSKLSDAIQIAYNELSYLNYSPSWHLDEKIKLLSQIDYQQIVYFSEHLLKRGKILSLLHGNFTMNQANRLAETIEQSFNFTAALDSEIPQFLQSQHKAGSQIKSLDSINNDSALLIQYQSNDRSLVEVAKARIFGQIVSDPFFHQLRTIEQLGYVVYSSSYSLLNISYLIMAIQSPNKSPSQLENRVNEFNDGVLQILNNLSNSQFEETKSSIIKELNNDPLSINEWAAAYWSDLRTNQFEFSIGKNLIPYIESTTIKEVIDYWQGISAENQRQLSIWVKGVQHEKMDQNETNIKDTIEYKRSLNRYSEIF